MFSEEKFYTSKYIIYVPYKKEKKFILLHGYGGAVDLVEPEVVDYLKRMQRKANNAGLDLPDLAPETVARLRKRGYLTTRTPEEEEAYLCQIGEIIHQRQSNTKSTFFLCPTYKCQLRCKYCFELKLHRKGRNYMERCMSPKVVDAAFDAIHRIQSDQKKVGQITLFGGEPLLAENVDIVAYILEKCRRSGFSDVVAVTNGIELDKCLYLLGSELGRIRELQITLDGPQEIHDKRRYGPKQARTFETIVANIPKALETGAKVTIRTNVDQKNLEHIDELAKLYHERGWSKKPNFGAYCQIVFKPNLKENGLGISMLKLSETIERKKKEYPHIRFMHGSFGVGRVVTCLLEKGPLSTFHPGFCGANSTMYVFDAWGDIFVCTEAIGDASAKIGTFYPKFEFLDTILEYFRNRTIMNIPVCRKCPWALFCGGGCMQHARETKGGYYNNFCAEYQALFVKLVPNVYEQWLHLKWDGTMKVHDLARHPGLREKRQIQ